MNPMEREKLHILVIEDDPFFAEVVQRMLQKPTSALALQVELADRLAAGMERLAAGGIDVVLLDLSLPDSQGLATLRQVLSQAPQVAVVISTGLADDEMAVDAVRQGAQDYLLKGQLDGPTLLRAVRHAIERKRIQDELRKLSLAVEQSPSITVITDLQARIEYVNPRFSQVTGYSVAEVLGNTPRLWKSGQTTPAVYRELWDTINGGNEWRGEFLNRRKCGELYWEFASISPVRDTQGRPTHFVKVAEDITTRKRAEESLHRARDELELRVQERTAELLRINEALRDEIAQRKHAEEADQIKTQFVSNVSHELRTPLSVIVLLSGNLDMLYDRLGDDKRRQMIREVREHARILNDLLGSVLEISRIESGRVSLERQQVELLRLAREESAAQLPLAQRKAQEVAVAGDAELTVWANEEQIRRVIRNLLNNAIKYTPEHGHISCQCVEWPGGADVAWPGSADLPAGRWAALRVVDSGPGIRAESLPHIFERFYRVATEGNVPGTGLGLAIAQELVHLHGGQIAVTSQPGQGSTFAVYLPVDRRKESPA
jgi:PAS domain S-box-containing protein